MTGENDTPLPQPERSDNDTQATATAVNPIGVIAIGRNEGERLRLCLESVVGHVAQVVYVDSGSTDGSVELAESLGVEVVDLDLSIPFTAARARNEGFAWLQEIMPDVKYVQMIDGDCEVVEGWLETAVAFLDANPKFAVACGRRRERFPDATIYNKLTDMEWDTPIGMAKSCGGDALFRAKALREVGGYNPTVIAGEEPEMCVRLRQAGWTIERLDAEMTLHDAAMTKFSQWWKRNVRAGHAYAQGAAMHGKADGHNVKQVRSNFVWAFVFGQWLNVTLSLLILLVNLLFVVWLEMPKIQYAFICIVIVCLWIILTWLLTRLWLRIRDFRLSKDDQPSDATLYATFTVLGKIPNAWGAIKYYERRFLGRKSEIIEYKTSGAVTA
ncbi:MAG: glycosyltransferase [Planctomycetota bacterium]